MISEEQLESLRQSGVKVRVIRDANPENDVKGYIVAWDDKDVLIPVQTAESSSCHENIRLRSSINLRSL